jgi:hypothetical protein
MDMSKFSDVFSNWWPTAAMILAAIGTAVSNNKSAELQKRIDDTTTATKRLANSIHSLTKQNGVIIKKSYKLEHKIDGLTQKIDKDATLRTAETPVDDVWLTNKFHGDSPHRLRLMFGEKYFHYGDTKHPVDLGIGLEIPRITIEASGDNGAIQYSFEILNRLGKPIIQMTRNQFHVFNSAADYYKISMDENHFQVMSKDGIVFISIELLDLVVKIRGVFNQLSNDQALLVGDSIVKPINKDDRVRLLMETKKVITGF